MAKKIAFIFMAILPVAACDTYGFDGYGGGYGVTDTAKAAAIGGLVGGATSYVTGNDVAQGAALGAIATTGASLLRQ